MAVRAAGAVVLVVLVVGEFRVGVMEGWSSSGSPAAPWLNAGLVGMPCVGRPLRGPRTRSGMDPGRVRQASWLSGEG